MAKVKTPVNRIKLSVNGKEIPAGNKATLLVIPEPCDRVIEIPIRGITPLVVHAWNLKAIQQLQDKKSLTADDVQMMQDPDWKFENSKYVSTDGWEGIHAGAFKCALVDALPVAGIPREEFSQVLARKTFFIVADGESRIFHEPLVRIYGKAERYDNTCRVSNGNPYPNTRAMYREWKAKVRIRFNERVINRQGVLNLLAYAGYYCGIHEHRPSCPESKTGTFGCWEIETSK